MIIVQDRAEAAVRARGTFGVEDANRRATSSGDEVLLREAVPEDTSGLQSMFVRCSRETIYLRFHMAWPTVPGWAVELLVGAGFVDRDSRAIVAVEGENIVGHAMYVKEQAEAREAEVAVIVEDGRNSSGVGRLLLSRITEEARRAGVEVLTCTTLGDNYRLLSIVRRAFPESHTSYADGTCSIRVPLTPPEVEETVGRENIR